MIVAEDDLLGHATSASFGAEPARVHEPGLPDTAQSIFTERYWYMGALIPEGDIVFGAGLGYYANRKIMDGYAGVTLNGTQHAFSASRRCADDPLTPAIGPLRIEIEEPMRMHRIVLEENESGLALDLRFTAGLPINDEGRDRVVRRGEVVADVSRYVQMGRWDGWIEAAGQRVRVEAAQSCGARDRSWGLRTEARTDESAPPVTRFNPVLFLWVCAQFEGHGYHFFLKEDAPGVVRSLVGNQTFSSGAPAREIASVEHDLEWRSDPCAQRVARGELRLHFVDGSITRLSVRVMPGWFALKAGLYGGFEGWFQGDDKGALHTASRSWDLHDPSTRRKLRTLAEQVVEFREGGATGFGTLQAGVAKGFGRYPEVQELPFM